MTTTSLSIQSQSPLDYMITKNLHSNIDATDGSSDIQQDNYTLRVIDNENALFAENNEPTPYKPTLNSVQSTPEIQHANIETLNKKESKTLLHLEPPELPQHDKKQHSRNPSLTPSITPSIVSTHQHQQQQRSNPSRYSKASYSLTSHPDAIKLYRDMANKTKDPMVQLTFAKYVLEIANLYNPKRQPIRPNIIQNNLPSFLQQRRESFSSMNSSRSSIHTQASINSIEKRVQEEAGDDENQPGDEKKKKMLEDEGIHWIKKLAKQDIGEACYLLGLWYDRGMYGFTKSPSKALKFYEVAAKDKIPEAMFSVGQQHEKNQDYMTAFQLYEEAASLGLVEALYRIAIINLNGEFGSRRNIVAAIQLLTKASEKSTGSCPEAPYTLGLLLLNDYPSVELSKEIIQSFGGTFAATTYLESAAEMGMALAQYRLGYIYENGLYGIRVNITKAVQYYEMAANTNNYGYAMLGLSRIHNQGVKLPHEQQQQSSVFELDESGWIKNHTRNTETAFEWCHMASKQNIPDACYLLGWYYEVGTGVTRDLSRAYHYYMKAIKKGKHKEASERVELLETLLKHQKDEKKKLQQENKRATILNKKANKESQCHIM